MLYISNCGNLSGPDLNKENNPEHVAEALEKGYHVVVDVWVVNDQKENTLRLALGNLMPQYSVDLEFFQNPNVIARAKSLQTFQLLIDNNTHCFLDSKDAQLTTRGLLWTPMASRRMVPRAVLNLPEVITNDIAQALNVAVSGVCSNFIERVKGVHLQLLAAAEQAAKEAEAAEEKKELDIIPEAEEENAETDDKPDSASSVETVETEDGANILVMKEG